jgi:cytochrome c oxidase subunit 3
MSTSITTDVKVGSVREGGSGAGPFDPGDPKNWPPGYSRDDAIEPAKYRIGMWVAIGSIAMLFLSLTSAYLFREDKGAGRDWIPIRIPLALWISTAVIMASSLSFEIARRALRRNDYAAFSRWIAATTALGLCFLAGQILAWRELRAQGVYLNSNPHSSFFYLLTSLHGIHLAGGLIALGIVTTAALRLRISARKRNMAEVTAIYWHFMDALWIYLFALLFFL